MMRVQIHCTVIVFFHPLSINLLNMKAYKSIRHYYIGLLTGFVRKRYFLR